MAFSIQYHVDSKLVVAQLFAVIDNSTYLQYISEIESQGPFPVEVDLLLVFGPEASLEVESHVIRESARRQQVFNSDALRVVVAPTDLAFGLSRLYALESANASDQYRFVHSLVEAAEILNRPLEELTRLIESKG